MPAYVMLDATLHRLSSLSLSSADWIAPSEPCTSALRITRSSAVAAAAELACGGVGQLDAAIGMTADSTRRCCLPLIDELARPSRSSSKTWTGSPACGSSSETEDLDRRSSDRPGGRVARGRRTSP